jgi:S-formylglutathione hydrolase FrmB
MHSTQRGVRGWAAHFAFTAALIFLGASLFALPARADGRAECRSLPSKILGRAVPYCVLLPPSFDASKTSRYPVLYFLHGMGENEQVLLDSGGWDLIQDLWEKAEIGEFVIAAPAADRTFYINSKDGRVCYEDFFIHEFVPYIESHYRGRPGRHYTGIEGISMGGYGALHLALRYPQLFGSVSAQSPALIASLPRVTMDPYEQNMLSRALGTAFGSPFDAAYWDRNSPFTIVKNSPKPVGLQIYFDCGTEDSYGFNKGAQAFHDLLVSKGIPHEFHLYPGGHDWSYFAQHFPASLEFQSRAFGLTTPAK